MSAEQELLRDGLGKFLTTRYTLEASRAAAKTGSGWQPEIWRSFADELGILGASLPESVGGSGGGPVESMVIAEKLGRAQVIEPYIDTVVVAGGLLQRVGGAAAQTVLERICEGSAVGALAVTETGSGASRTLTPATVLPTGATCTFTISASGVRNGAGIALATNVTATFTVTSGTVSGYYAQVNTSSPDQLRCSLHATIKGHTKYPYSGSGQNVWTILEVAQQDPNNPNKIIDVYRNRSYTIGSDRAGTPAVPIPPRMQTSITISCC